MIIVSLKHETKLFVMCQKGRGAMRSQHRSEPKLNHIPCIILEKRSASDLEKTLKILLPTQCIVKKIIQFVTQIRAVLLMKKVQIQRNVNAINELSLAQCLSFEFLVVFILQSENALSSFPEKRIFCKLVQAFY